MTAHTAPPSGRRKAPVRWYWWPLWIALLAIGIFIFYVLFTPAWIAIRLTAWLSEHRSRHRREPRSAQ